MTKDVISKNFTVQVLVKIFKKYYVFFKNLGVFPPSLYVFQDFDIHIYVSIRTKSDCPIGMLI